MNVKDQIVDLGDNLLKTIIGTINQACEKVKGELLDTFCQLGKIYGHLDAKCVDNESLKLVGFPKEEKEEAELIVLNKGGANDNLQ